MSYIVGFDLDRVDSSAEFAPGTVAQDEDGQVYKYVKLDNTTATVAGVAGDVVAYAAATGHSTSTVVTDFTDADAKPVGAGVLMATVAGLTTAAEYVWVKIKGTSTINLALAGTPADGDELMASTTDKTLTLRTYAGTTPAITAAGALVAVAADASAKLVVCDFPY